MPKRPVALTAGALLGMSALFATAVPAAADAQESFKGAPTPVAHRGASGYAPENTLAAVDKAAALGIRWVENDVQRTRDGKLVVIHDTTLDRTTDAEEVYPDRAPWNVGDFTAAEIAKLDAGSWFGKKYAGTKVPTLKQYLARVGKHDRKLLLELKEPGRYPGIEAQTLKELSNEGWLDADHVDGKLIVQSFDAGAVANVHLLKPAVKTGFLGKPDVDDLGTYALFTDQINPSSSTLTKDYVDAVHAVRGAHGKPMQVLTWTVNDAKGARAAAKAGVDGIISNFPDVVRDALED
ncbi:glycerophosphodiester phosphodiesterase family protein [Streptomyces sp. Z26]|uniref:glycerophosphodiester phosphodiesterase n=1 Tax=Streptomyces sp. Z26 TaxID=2500177 RepID=UPI000EF15B1F|nr:glycerophosphodiester phosphodiesterase family protein [Streptomyces sp. Z26]RLL66291.1 glycerophosphodiester phosphodiesterase [Streptomyces sp. Z26]